MKIVAIIILVAVLGFVGYKFVLKKKTKPAPTKATPKKAPTRPRRGGSSVSPGGYFTNK